MEVQESKLQAQDIAALAQWAKLAKLEFEESLARVQVLTRVQKSFDAQGETDGKDKAD